MLDYVSDIIVKIMQYISSKDILEGKVGYDRIGIPMLKKICFAVDGNVNENTLQKRLQSLGTWTATELREEKIRPDAADGETDKAVGIFDLIYCLTSKVLTTNHGEIVYKYDMLKPWHNLTGKIGTNLVAACAYARQDYRISYQRTSFLWKEILDHDNHALNRVLDKKMSENHYHLRGSSSYFILSWLSMMNSVTMTRTSRYLEQLDENLRNPKVRYRRSFDEDGFPTLHLKAAAIRVYLYSFLTDQMVQFEEYRTDILWLLRHIVGTEPVTELIYAAKENLPECRVSEYEYLREYFEGLFQNSGNGEGADTGQKAQNSGLLSKVREMCPVFYSFFWKLYAYIPTRVLSDQDLILCGNNLECISEYVTSECAPLPLEQCADWFRRSHWQKYKAEWNRQTRNALMRLLREPDKLWDAREHIQYMIDTFQNHNALGYKDYALNEVEPWDREDWERAIMSGERWLIYTMMHRRFFYKKGDKKREDWVYNLFFAYLVIKECFRMELLQNNDRPGFDNFRIYQKRKDWFTTSFSEGELARIAVREALRRQNLKSLELRIMPGNSSEDNIRMLRRYDANIDVKGEWVKNGKFPYYYVFHFGKRPDEEKNKFLRYRHEKYRSRLKRQTNAIIRMREKNPETGMRLKGIDACSSEDGCRPEVFAVAFRTLKNHVMHRTDTGEKMPQLGISYHVGEENQDVLDGLRAIDEAVFFMNLDSNDRIGHATMLGVDVWEWYRQNDFKISCRRHDYLDNIVWLYNRIIHYHISNQDNLLEYLDSEFQTYFGKIYIHTGGIDTKHNAKIVEAKSEYDRWRQPADFRRDETGQKRDAGPDRIKEYPLEFNIYNYYHAWELRGDDPELYQEGFFNEGLLTGSGWDECRKNPELDSDIRQILESGILYYAYHYDENVHTEGEKTEVFQIPYHMIKGIELVQKAMQKDIARKGISIETNPSSNVMISQLFDLGHHPIVSFYNKGLTYDTEKLNSCPQLNVSINTDDLGVFTTCLYNEYTLMAHALEDLTDQDGNAVYRNDMIYDWIDNVRKMGNSQPFGKKTRRK